MQKHDSRTVPSLAIPLSTMFLDPALRVAFSRAERDDGFAFAVAAPRAPVLTGGAVQLLEVA